MRCRRLPTGEAASAPAPPKRQITMSVEPAKQNPVATASASAKGAATSGANEAHEMFDALNAAFRTEGEASGHGRLSLPDALWELGPPSAIRSRNGKISFANPAFKDLLDALADADALPPADDLAAVIEGLGHPYTEDLVLRLEGEPHFPR